MGNVRILALAVRLPKAHVPGPAVNAQTVPLPQVFQSQPHVDRKRPPGIFLQAEFRQRRVGIQNCEVVVARFDHGGGLNLAPSQRGHVGSAAGIDMVRQRQRVLGSPSINRGRTDQTQFHGATVAGFQDCQCTGRGALVQPAQGTSSGIARRSAVRWRLHADVQTCSSVLLLLRAGRRKVVTHLLTAQLHSSCHFS